MTWIVMIQNEMKAILTTVNVTSWCARRKPRGTKSIPMTARSMDGWRRHASQPPWTPPLSSQRSSACS
jgi:hypothetical protein